MSIAKMRMLNSHIYRLTRKNRLRNEYVKNNSGMV